MASNCKNSDNILLNCGFINIQSVGNKTMEIRELINDRKFDILSFAETWLNEHDKAKIAEMTPHTHTFLHIPRQGRVGGGVGLFLLKCFSEIKIINHHPATTFEHIEVSFKYKCHCFSFTVVYRPPSGSARIFFEEFEEFLESIDMMRRKAVICGDFNFWLDDVSNSNTINFNDMLTNNQLLNNTNRTTTSTGHMLDLIICDSLNKIVTDVVVEERCRFSSIHKLISFRIPISIDKMRKKITFRNKSDFNARDYITDISTKIDALLLTQCIHSDRNATKSDCVDCLMNLYNLINKNEYETRCPEVEKTIVIMDKSPWFNGETLNAKREKRRKERAWLNRRTEDTWLTYCNAKNSYNNLIKQTKINYYRLKILEATNDPRKLYRLLNTLTGCDDDCRS